MSQFATEFLVPKTFVSAAFAAHILAWIRGMKHSHLLETVPAGAFDGDDIRIDDGVSEALHLRALGRGAHWVATGCRYDYVDPDQRLWRTEAVLRNLPGRGNLLRVRAQCLARETLVRLEVPKRTHLIRMLLDEGAVLDDGLFRPACAPHRLSDDSAGLDQAEAIIRGAAVASLPVVYLSALEGGGWALRRDEVARLATDLGGVAHVVCEPSREFSFRLRDRVGGGNVYNGSIGLSPPGGGFVRRAYLGASLRDSRSLAQHVLALATALRSEMPSVGGWDWIDLQEYLIRGQRAAERNRLTGRELEALWQDELLLKDERIRDLEAELRDARSAVPGALTEAEQRPAEAGMPEIYPGEIRDRLRAALDFCLEKGADAGWDRRSLAVFEQLLAQHQPSGELEEVRQELWRATRDGKRLNKELKRLLPRYGFVDKSDNKHTRMEPAPGFDGLESITVMKTPGDRRGLDNLLSQIEGKLGITRLKKLR